jgi:hypothetical protein
MPPPPQVPDCGCIELSTEQDTSRKNQQPEAAEHRHLLIRQQQRNDRGGETDRAKPRGPLDRPEEKVHGHNSGQAAAQAGQPAGRWWKLIAGIAATSPPMMPASSSRATYEQSRNAASPFSPGATSI